MNYVSPSIDQAWYSLKIRLLNNHCEVNLYQEYDERGNIVFGCVALYIQLFIRFPLTRMKNCYKNNWRFSLQQRMLPRLVAMIPLTVDPGSYPEHVYYLSDTTCLPRVNATNREVYSLCSIKGFCGLCLVKSILMYSRLYHVKIQMIRS